MAKIGNEAKLILKLAKEKMDREVERLHRMQTGTMLVGKGKFIVGQLTGIEFYNQTLQKIINDMER